jgi:archaellum component FlaC
VINIQNNDNSEDPGNDVSNQEMYDAINQQGLNPGSPRGGSPRAANVIPPVSEDSYNPLEGLDQFEGSQNSANSKEAEEELLEEAPSPDVESSEYSSYEQPSSEDYRMMGSSSEIQGLIESIIEEKWEDFMTRSGDISLWKEQVNNDLIAIKQEIIRTQDRFENIQKSIMRRVGEYGDSVKDMNTELKALDQVFRKILQPLTENIRELQRVTTTISSRTAKQPSRAPVVLQAAPVRRTTPARRKARKLSRRKPVITTTTIKRVYSPARKRKTTARKRKR